MAMKDESEFPRLTPPDDRFPAPDRLLRKPEELTDEQFDLLAAAWSEEALSGDRLSELEAVMTANPSRKMRAESFSRVKLVPYDDRWAGRNMLLRQSPATRGIKRNIVVTLLAAAAVVMFIITGPAIKNRTTDIAPGALPDGAAMSDALIPEAYPVIIPDRVKPEPAGVRSVTEAERPAGVPRLTEAERLAAVRTAAMTEPLRSASATDMTDNGKAVPDVLTTEPQRTLPVALAINAVNPVIIAAAGTTDIQAMKMAAVIPAPGPDKADNWIIRGISLLARTVTKEEKKVDGYYIASACVTGINNFLGWEMELEQASNKKGEAVAVNFSSSLLSFSAPVNKNSP
jgi:hypothetical protein